MMMKSDSSGEDKEISITYIPRHSNTLDNFYDDTSIVLKQSFLDAVDEDFLEIMLSERIDEHIPAHIVDEIIAYSERYLEKDITVVFTY